MSVDLADERVASPCTSVCTMDAATGLCAGCLRTLDEIATWIDLGNEERRALLVRLAARRRTLANVTAHAARSAGGEG